MVGAVENRPGEVVEAGVDQIEGVAAHPLDRADLGDEEAALGDEVAARLDLQAERVAERVLEPLAGGVPEAEVGGDVDTAVARPVRGRQAAAGADRCRGWGRPRGPACSIAPQTWERCSRSVPEPMCMCSPVIVRPCRAARRQAVAELIVPDAVLRLLAAGVRLLAVAVAEAGIDPQRDRPARRPLADWSIMSGEPQLTWRPCSTTRSSDSRSKMSAV